MWLQTVLKHAVLTTIFQTLIGVQVLDHQSAIPILMVSGSATTGDCATFRELHHVKVFQSIIKIQPIR